MPTCARNKALYSNLYLRISTNIRNHFTNRSYITVPNYNIYYTNHPDEIAHGGTAVIIRENIKHYVRAEYRYENIRATNIAVEDNTAEITVSAIYCPPKHHSRYDDYDICQNIRKQLLCWRRL